MQTAEATPVRLAAPGRRPGPLRRAIRELALVAVLFGAYKLGRLAVVGRAGTAVANGEFVWHLERLLRLPSEVALQHPVLSAELLARLANSYYAYVHFPATIGCLLWLYLRRPAHYRWTRRGLAALTAAALALHLLVPLAPPRLTPLTGMVDTGSRYGPAVYGPPGTDEVSNQYAAMPSLHVGWAIAVGVALVATTAGRRRWLWLAHPIVTALVVVVTGNHYWLDGIVATAMLAIVLMLLPAPADGDRPSGRSWGCPRGRPDRPPGSTRCRVGAPAGGWRRARERRRVVRGAAATRRR
ncbi:phosphatase PAP2 family protein [Micromonospora sp. RTGN7]|uniref:phosphatase PAP2 family protein n=1 Tax=Micromonospora sp. RTGN7 TaxID=3016526 RepID=UPI0029FF4C2A|nr:phosphatase PAP2 family protein [Micromonospora sp. RTGN7]